jgi:hypothetical protein
MKLPLAVIFALALAQAAQADDFTARTEAGRSAAATAAGSAVGQSVKPVLLDVSYTCDPPGTVLPASDLGPLDLVGDITQHGILTNMEARPQTPLAACFIANLSKRYFFPPHWVGNYPLFIHLVVSN